VASKEKLPHKETLHYPHSLCSQSWIHSIECTWNTFHKEYLHDVYIFLWLNPVWKPILQKIKCENWLFLRFFVVIVYIAAGILGEVDEGSNYKEIRK